jgi:D-lactate dehydrogenase
MKIAMFSARTYDKDSFESLNHSHQINYFETSLTPSTVALAEGHDGVCAFVNDRLDAEVLQVLSQAGITAVFMRCAGFNNVDLSAARRFGIRVYRVPAYSPEAVAEHAMALILCLSRKIHKAYNRVRDNNFSLERLTGMTLHGKTLGLVGTGHIGKALAHIAMGFGMNIFGYDLNPDPELQGKGVTYGSLDELFTKSDIISLHVPLLAETKHMIRKQTIREMKDGVMIINTSRGGLIHTKDVIKALKSHKIGYLGIDVYEQEENLFFEDHSEIIIQDDLVSRLMTFPNVLITSHQAFLTREALNEIALITCKNMNDHENGRETANCLV